MKLFSRQKNKEFSSEGLKFFEKKNSIWCCIPTIKTASGLPHFDYQYNKINGILPHFFGKNEGITFPDINFKHTRYQLYSRWVWLSYWIQDVGHFWKFDHGRCRRKYFRRWLSFWLVCREATEFYSRWLIDYQYVGDIKAPLIRVIESKQRLKNGSSCEIEPTKRIVFSNLEYK